MLFLFLGYSAFCGVDTGYIYVIKNPTFKGATYKIGMTRQSDPMVRIKQLYTTSIPRPFDVVLIVKSDSALADERRIHKKLKKYRIDKRREFFKADIRRIKCVVNENITRAK